MNELINKYNLFSHVLFARVFVLGLLYTHWELTGVGLAYKANHGLSKDGWPLCIDSLKLVDLFLWIGSWAPGPRGYPMLLYSAL